MVTVYGMNDKVGNISFYVRHRRIISTKPRLQQETGKMIDNEVGILIDEAYQKTKNLLPKQNRWEKLAKELLVREVLFKVM